MLRVCEGSVASGITTEVMARSRVDDLARVVEPSHMRVAGGEKAIGYREARIVLDREEQLRHRLVEAPAEEVRGANDDRATGRLGRAGLRRSAVSACSIAISGSPAQSLRRPLMFQPRA